MAGRDYILCCICGKKVIYDGKRTIRDYLEHIWGDPKAPDWTVQIPCPGCFNKLREENKSLQNDVLADKDKKFLNWVADRLTYIYGESENVDFVLHLRKLAKEQR